MIGAAMEVHRELGCGLLERPYQEALALELGLRSIPFRREVELPIHYKGHALACKYIAEFLCFDHLIVETKALRQLSNAERAQVISQLKASRLRLGLLINFGSTSLEYERIAN